MLTVIYKADMCGYVTKGSKLFLVGSESFNNHFKENSEGERVVDIYSNENALLFPRQNSNFIHKSP